jgi:hypothetical protein
MNYKICNLSFKILCWRKRKLQKWGLKIMHLSVLKHSLFGTWQLHLRPPLCSPLRELRLAAPPPAGALLAVAGAAALLATGPLFSPSLQWRRWCAGDCQRSRTHAGALCLVLAVAAMTKATPRSSAIVSGSLAQVCMIYCSSSHCLETCKFKINNGYGDIRSMQCKINKRMHVRSTLFEHYIRELWHTSTRY